MIERTINKEIINTIKNKPVTIIAGARQVGKTTPCTEIEMFRLQAFNASNKLNI